ncbi:MAG TPA: hypothetical protein VG944_08455 [Fimbriimonas sp.]|nr:hypothetical protein [Fimbriimonas sp.]
MRGDHVPVQYDVTPKADDLLRMFNSPAWAELQKYLLWTRKRLVKQNIKTYNPQSQMIEIARNQGAIQIIDEILSETPESAKHLVSKISDHKQQEGG